MLNDLGGTDPEKPYRAILTTSDIHKSAKEVISSEAFFN